MQNENELFVMCENIKRIRTAHGLSEKDMAEVLGISVYVLTKLEAGDISLRLKADAIIRLCRRFGIEPKDVFVPM